VSWRSRFPKHKSPSNNHTRGRCGVAYRGADAHPNGISFYPSFVLFILGLFNCLALDFYSLTLLPQSCTTVYLSNPEYGEEILNIDKEVISNSGVVEAPRCGWERLKLKLKLCAPRV